MTTLTRKAGWLSDLLVQLWSPDLCLGFKQRAKGTNSKAIKVKVCVHHHCLSSCLLQGGWQVARTVEISSWDRAPFVAGTTLQAFLFTQDETSEESLVEVHYLNNLRAKWTDTAVLSEHPHSTHEGCMRDFPGISSVCESFLYLRGGVYIRMTS